MKFTYTVFAFLLSFTLCSAQSTNTGFDDAGNTVLRDSKGKIVLVGTKDLEGNIIWKNADGKSLETEVLSADALELTSLDKAIIRANKKKEK